MIKFLSACLILIFLSFAVGVIGQIYDQPTLSNRAFWVGVGFIVIGTIGGNIYEFYMGKRYYD